MISNHNIFLSNTFKNDFTSIIKYIKYDLKEPKIADKYYNLIISKINTLKYLPERNQIIPNLSGNSLNLRKLQIKNYFIIYKIDSNTRKHLYSTYFSWFSKLFKL